MPKCSSRDQSLPVGTRAFAPKGLHLVRISVHPLDFYVARARVLLIVLIFVVVIVVVLLLL
jgi:hypothetical protein